ncbi:hypothetical protein JX266_011900 [Neoarthrinium moseri]|nr:hypothetical protein JX266_011900 [Neoarthrinium moseri]
MDPFSIISGVAGISAAGASLSRLILDIVSGARNAPKEAFDIARAISDLSIILSELRRVLKDGSEIYRRKLLRRVQSAMRRIERLHGVISEMLDVTSKTARIMWSFRRSKATTILYQIESHKTGINMILHTMVLAVQLKQLARSRTSINDVQQTSDKDDVLLARQQAENLVQMSYCSIRDLLDQGGQGQQSSMGDPDIQDDGDSNVSDHDDEGSGETNSSNQLMLRKIPNEDAAMWLYDLVFSPATDADASDGAQRPNAASTPEATETSPDPEVLSNSTELILHQQRRVNQLQHYVREPAKRSSVVNELLAEWTTLAEDEIEVALSESEQPGNESEVQVIHFKDAVGRKFSFPWAVAKKWKGMTGYIMEAFVHVDVLGPHVQAGHYDLVGPNGVIILPSTWEVLARAGDAITMQMWPIDVRSTGPKSASPNAAPTPSTGFQPIPRRPPMPPGFNIKQQMPMGNPNPGRPGPPPAPPTFNGQPVPLGKGPPQPPTNGQRDASSSPSKSPMPSIHLLPPRIVPAKRRSREKQNNARPVSE